MSRARNVSRSGFTLLEALLGLVLLSTIVLVLLAACQRSLRTLRHAKSLDEAVKLAEQVAADPSGTWTPPPSTHDLSWRIEAQDREIAPEITLKQWTIVVEQPDAKRPLCKLQLLSRADAADAAEDQQASRSSRR